MRLILIICTSIFLLSSCVELFVADLTLNSAIALANKMNEDKKIDVDEKNKSTNVKTCEKLSNSWTEIYCELRSRSGSPLISGKQMLADLYIYVDYIDSHCPVLDLEKYSSYTTTNLESVASELETQLKSCSRN
tara:strand:+ start:179 stop:580 length:402 start_codon:yes stop_codon:yes gene_type:complete